MLAVPSVEVGRVDMVYPPAAKRPSREGRQRHRSGSLGGPPNNDPGARPKLHRARSQYDGSLRKCRGKVKPTSKRGFTDWVTQYSYCFSYLISLALKTLFETLFFPNNSFLF